MESMGKLKPGETRVKFGISFIRLDDSHQPYKYELLETYSIKTSLRPKNRIGNQYVFIDINGYLVLKKGYRWDGPSGPALDTEDFMRGSLVHDGIYQLIREGFLSFWRKIFADRLMAIVNNQDGMHWFRVGYTWLAVTIFGYPIKWK